ncbi:sensor histidine kinase [Guggenheimella bovis]
MKNSSVVTLRLVLMVFCLMGLVLSQNYRGFAIIFFLSTVLLSQVVYYSFFHDFTKQVILLLEIISLMLTVKYFSGFAFAVVGMVATDISLCSKGKWRILHWVLFYGGLFYVLYPPKESFFFLASLGFIIFLAFHSVQIEGNLKVEAQALYDKLRQTEEELREANEELKDYAKSIEEITKLRERNRIARDIHDSAGHALSTLNIQLGALEKMVDESQRELVTELKSFTKSSLDDVRRTVHALKPKEQLMFDGVKQIEQLITNFKRISTIEITKRVSPFVWNLSEDQSSVFYRAVQEFLSNTQRHSDSTKVDITILFEEVRVILTMHSNGLVEGPVIFGMGLSSMKERTEELGGEMAVRTDDGFTVRIELPRQEALV